MQPTLREGMQIEVEEVASKEVKLADIILYRNHSAFICHRVIKIIQDKEQRIFVTKGDNHAYIDAGLIPEKELIGVVRVAFWENQPKRDVLIKNRLLSILYVIIGNSAFFLRQKSRIVPGAIRNIFKPLVGGFFIFFKKTIHFIQSGISYEHLFFRRISSPEASSQ